MKIEAINPQTWYSKHVSFELPVLKAYVQGVEKQIGDLADWKKNLEVVGFVGDPETEYYQDVSAVAGLNDLDYSLETIFDDYFPQLQRQSALIVTYSFLERELGHLCDLCHKSFNAPSQVKDQKTKGSVIAGYHSYLEKVIGLAISKNNKQWQIIDHGIRMVRNQIVHDDGRIPVSQKDLKKIQEHIKQLSSQDLISIDGNSIVLKPGYLEYVLTTFYDFFKILDVAVTTLKTTRVAASKGGILSLLRSKLRRFFV